MMPLAEGQHPVFDEGCGQMHSVPGRGDPFDLDWRVRFVKGLLSDISVRV